MEANFSAEGADIRMKFAGSGHGAGLRLRRRGEHQNREKKAACFKRPCRFVLYFAGSGSFPQPHSATLTGRTYTPSAA